MDSLYNSYEFAAEETKRKYNTAYIVGVLVFLLSSALSSESVIWPMFMSGILLNVQAVWAPIYTGHFASPRSKKAAVVVGSAIVIALIVLAMVGLMVISNASWPFFVPAIGIELIVAVIQYRRIGSDERKDKPKNDLLAEEAATAPVVEEPGDEVIRMTFGTDNYGQIVEDN